jgi:alkylation response protein AidB-like acyl-CoA dehydrogenase
MSNLNVVEQLNQADWSKIAKELSASFAQSASMHDDNDSFVEDNFESLTQHRLFSACIPQSLGGGGASYSEFCDLLRIVAQGCGSTALALSMHSHLVAANLWKYAQGQPVEGLLSRIAIEQLVLISTGASDWLHASGKAQKTEGGYIVNARKVFASGSPQGSLLITSAVYDDPEAGPTVLHFPIPFNDPGLSMSNNWKAMGMRGTGSNDITINDVFVPEASIALRRAQGVWHPFFNVVCCVALPLITSVYVGVAESAATLTRGKVQFKKHDPHLPYQLGEMENALTTAQMALREMVALVDEYKFSPTNESASKMLQCKTIASNAVIQCVEKCLETVGGSGFFRTMGLERLLRDIHGAQFHPLPEKRQQHFTGSVVLGLDPLG